MNETSRIPNERFTPPPLQFVDFIREQLSRLRNGVITISKQNGKVMHLTLTESQSNLRAYKEHVAAKAAGVGGTVVSDAELQDILEVLGGVKYGTVVLRLQDGQIIGVETNESVKM
ncbi:MAG: YezD family protein [Peptococcaceae bacterium]|jgi:hypothetical protein|nr:YezD family protein [Peptococcaceae bacterium]